MPLSAQLMATLPQQHPLVAQFLQANADVDAEGMPAILRTANEMSEQLLRPDSECHTGFGADLGEVLREKKNKVRAALINQLNPLALDADTTKVYLLPADAQALLSQTINTRAAWNFKFQPGLSTFYVTYRAQWSSPIFPGFQAQLVINEQTLNDPSKWESTGQLDDVSGVIELKPEYDPQTAVITLTSADGMYWIRHRCPDATITVLTSRNSFKEAMVHLTTWGGVLDKEKFVQIEHPDDRQVTLDRAEAALLKMYKGMAEPNPVFNKKLKLVDNGGVVPEVGGDRAKWLANEGALDVQKLHGLETDEEKAAYIHKSDMRFARLQRLQATTSKRFAELTDRIDAANDLLNQRALTLLVKSENPDPHEGDAVKELHDNPAARTLPAHLKPEPGRKPRPEMSDGEEEETSDKELTESMADMTVTSARRHRGSWR